MALDPVQSNPGLLQRAQSIMALRGYSLRTCAAYRGWIIRYVRFHSHRRPRGLGEAEVFRFLAYLGEEGGVATATETQALSALLFLYRDVLGRPLRVAGQIPRARRVERLPTVLSAHGPCRPTCGARRSWRESSGLQRPSC